MAEASVPAEWADYGARFGVDGRLYLGEWRAGFTVHQLRTMFWQCQQLRSVQQDLRNARLEIERLTQEGDQLRRERAFYRAQLVLESRMGMALARIAGDDA